MTLTNLYDWYVDRNGRLTRWQRGGTSATAPSAVTNAAVSITTSGTATVTWDVPDSDGGSPITGYTVSRIGGATHTLAASARSDTFTGLTAGTTYTFSVIAFNDIGSSPDTQVSGSSSSVNTVWGINSNQGYPYMTIAARQNWFNGRMPVLRTYDNPWSPGETYHVRSPEGRCAYSWKGGSGVSGGTGTYSDLQLSDGTAQATMRGWLASIPAGEQVWWCFHHEVNNSSGMEVTPSVYVNIYHQMRLALNATTLQAGVQVIICCNFNMISGTFPWNNSWVPSTADCDCFTVDLYGNPTPNARPNKYGGPPAGSSGVGLDSVYPLVSSRMAFAFSVIEATGFKDSWGVWEFNSPQRNWDTTAANGGTSPSIENGRKLWHADYIAALQSPPMTGHTPAKIALFWEAPKPPASTWDQRYGRLDGNPNRMVNMISPYITGTPRRR